MEYCQHCGHKLEVRKKDAEWYCASCSQPMYANPIPTVDALLIDEDGKVLLGRRSREPYKGRLNLPGGFMDMGETMEEAIARELKEELGLSTSDYGKLIYGGSRVDYHSEGGKKRQLVCIIMVGKMVHKDFEANDEVDEFVWTLPSQLKPEDVTTLAEYQHIMAAYTVSGLGS